MTTPERFRLRTITAVAIDGRRVLPRTELELQPLQAAELIVNGRAMLVDHTHLAGLMAAVQVARRTGAVVAHPSTETSNG